MTSYSFLITTLEQKLCLLCILSGLEFWWFSQSWIRQNLKLTGVLSNIFTFVSDDFPKDLVVINTSNTYYVFDTDCQQDYNELKHQQQFLTFHNSGGFFLQCFLYFQSYIVLLVSIIIILTLSSFLAISLNKNFHWLLIL